MISNMGQLIFDLVHLLRQLPEKNIEKVCAKLKLTDNKVFSEMMARQQHSISPYTDSLVAIVTNPSKGILLEIYRSIEGVLFVGGCAPGVGLAFNIIDACFCVALGYWIEAFIAIVSCIPIPGLKFVGKGFQKTVMSLLQNISPADMQNMTKLLGRQLTKIGFHTNDCYIRIGNKLDEIVDGVGNPFASDTIRLLYSSIKKMCKNNVPTHSVASFPDKHAVQQQRTLLELTNRSIILD